VVIRRRELTSEDVRMLVFESIELIADVQKELKLSITPNINKTYRRLKNGIFRAITINRKRKGCYSMDYGSFIPPSTIILDKKLPFSDEPLDMPELTKTMVLYSAVHEVVHADDHTGGDVLLLATRNHIMEEHQDKLRKGLRVVEQKGGSDCIRDGKDLAVLWAVQYVDMVTHYRSYVVLRHKRMPKLDYIWSRLSNDYFPPNLLTCIERHKNIGHVFEIFTRRVGEYCLVEALKEYDEIRERQACSYTV